MLITRRTSTANVDVPSSVSGDPHPVESVHVHAPSKVNLYLEIVGRRADGFHDLATLMLAVDLADELTFHPAPAGVLELTCDVPGLSTGPENLICKAARLLQEECGIALGARIELTKRIPWAAGLGGGSSDAAAALAGLNELWQCKRTLTELADLGGRLGSDVPFFFYTPAAWCTGRGEMVEPVRLGGTFDLVLVKPEMGLNTAAVFQHGAAKGMWAPPDARSLAEQRGWLVEALAQGDVERLGKLLFNRLEGPAFELAPAVKAWYRRLENTPALSVRMSGSGSCLFALCRNDREARQVVEDLQGNSPLGETGPHSGNELAGIRVFQVRSCI